MSLYPARSSHKAPPYFRAGGTLDNHLCEVFLGGVRLPLCIEADAEKGWAKSYATNKHGVILRGEECRVLQGDVEIRLCN